MTTATTKKKTTAKKTSETKEVATKADQLPVEMMEMFAEDLGAGQENLTADDFAIPRLAILQSNSPQVDKRGEGYVEGAEPSMIVENVSNGLFDGEEGIIVVPISFRRTIIEWGLRSKGGGFVADHGYNTKVLQSAELKEIDGKHYLLNEKGNSLVDTGEYFVYLISEGDWQPAVISMASTQLKKSKRWNTLIESVKINTPKGRQTPASFYMAYKLTTVPESNEKGSWFGWEIKKHALTVSLENGKDIYLSARDFLNQIKAGEVKVAAPDQEVGEDIESEDSPM